MHVQKETVHGISIFIRPGESYWNLADKICGATNIPLTEEPLQKKY